MKAIVADGSGWAKLATISVPTPSAGEILVKVTHIAQNPIDWGSLGLASAGAIVGCDFAGVIADANGSHWSEGTRVAGWVFGKITTPMRGSFAEYLVTEASQVFAVPEGTKSEEAATIPLAYATAAQVLFQRLGFPEPGHGNTDKTTFLVAGAASSVGMYAVQLAKASGLTVIATASPRNHEHIKELGASAVFDYTKPDWPTRVREFADIHYAIDTVATDETVKAIAQALVPSKSHIIAILPHKQADIPFSAEQIKLETTVGYSVFGYDFAEVAPMYGQVFQNATKEGAKQDKKFWEKQLTLLPKYLEAGKIKGNPIRLRGGLDDVLAGFEEHKEGKVRAEKLVYAI